MSRRCYYLFEAVFVGSKFVWERGQQAWRVLILLETGHEPGNTCARVGQVGFCAYPIGVADARCFCQLVLKGNCAPAYDLGWGTGLRIPATARLRILVVLPRARTVTLAAPASRTRCQERRAL